MGRMAPLPQEEEDPVKSDGLALTHVAMCAIAATAHGQDKSPTSTAHFPFGPLSQDPYDTFVKQQHLWQKDDTPVGLEKLKYIPSRTQGTACNLQAQAVLV